MIKRVIGFTLAVMGFATSYVASAGAVFNWVNETPPSSVASSFRFLLGAGRVEVADSVFLAAQTGAQPVFGSYVTTSGSNPAPYQVNVGSADVTVTWRSSATGMIIPVANCSVPLTCTPVFSSTKLLSAVIGFADVGIRANSDWAEAALGAEPYTANNFSLVGSDLTWGIGAVTGGWGYQGLTAGVSTYSNSFLAISGRWVLDQSTVAVPLPGTLALLLVGLSVAGLFQKRRLKR